MKEMELPPQFILENYEKPRKGNDDL